MRGMKGSAAWWAWVAAAVPGLGWMAVHFGGPELQVPLNALLPGVAIVGAAFILSWVTELAELDLPRSVAIVILALVAVLPEYAVDIYFAWQAGQRPEYIPYTLANMSGANQLLIGLGWASVVVLFFLRSRKREVIIAASYRLEICFLFVATAYSFILPLKRTLSLWDAAVFIALFVLYVRLAMRGEHEEPHLAGPAALIGRWPVAWRRVGTYAGFAFAAGVILISAEPFAEGLLEVGRAAQIDEFILVQWLAPLASESPEFIVALLFAARGRPEFGLGALISSKINQWTLLVGMLPVAFSLSAGSTAPLPLDDRQVAELLVTSAQSFFAVAILADMRFRLGEAVLLALIFLSHLPFTSETGRLAYAAAYVLLGLSIFARKPESRKGFAAMFRHVKGMLWSSGPGHI